MPSGKVLNKNYLLVYSNHLYTAKTISTAQSIFIQIKDYYFNKSVVWVMSKKIHITFDDGKNYTLAFDDNSQGVLSFLLDLIDRTNCEVVLLSGFSNQESDAINKEGLEKY